MAINTKKLKKSAIDDFKKYINFTQFVFLNTVGLDILETDRNGVHIRDLAGGDRMIDCFCSAGSFNVGRRNPRMLAALEKALETRDAGNYMFPSAEKVALAERLVSVTPEGLEHVMFCTGGGEANESAIKMARGLTGRPGVVSMVKGYHGHTGFSLSAIGKDVYRAPFEPLMPGYAQVPLNDIDALEKAVGDDTAAVILELVQGEAGIHIATQEYVDALRRVCDEHGAVLIFDEVQTGFCRTGKMFAGEHYSVVPDIMTVAKSLSGATYPISATIFNDRVNGFVESHPEMIVSTSGGSDLGCAVGCEVIDYMQEEKIPEHAQEMGDYIGSALLRLKDKHAGLVKDVRRLGMMMGLEYEHDMMGPLMSFFLGMNGVMAIFSANNPRVMRFMPPVIITREEADRLIEAVDKSMATAGRNSKIIMALSKIPILQKAISVQELQIFLILITKTLRRVVPW